MLLPFCLHRGEHHQGAVAGEDIGYQTVVDVWNIQLVSNAFSCLRFYEITWFPPAGASDGMQGLKQVGRAFAAVALARTPYVICCR